MLNNEMIDVPQDKIIPNEDVVRLLKKDLASQKVMEKNIYPNLGELVGVRLNLNILKSTGCAIQTLHQSTNNIGYKKNNGFYNGEARGYAQVVVLKNAYFNVNQKARAAIAEGTQHKFAMASIDGQLEQLSLPKNFKGVEISFNPHNHHLFVDKNYQAIHFAEEVVILGHRAYARGKIVFHTEQTAPPKVGQAPSLTKVLPSEIKLSPEPVFAVKQKSKM